jgi:hypothetical protein
MLLALRAAGCRTVYIDGSFVTRERWPNDFDLCYDPAHVENDALPTELRDFSGRRAAMKAIYGGEAFPATFPFDWTGRTVLEFFQRDKESGAQKGIVQLNLQTVE